MPLWIYALVAIAVTLTSVAQILIGFRMRGFIAVADKPLDFLMGILEHIFSPILLAAFFLLAVAVLCWLTVLTKMQVSVAILFGMLTVPITVGLSSLLLGGEITVRFVIGGTLILVGVFVIHN